METQTINTQIPKALIEHMNLLVKEGWYLNIDSIIIDALRHYIDSHQPELMEQFIREDVEWGLNGKD